MKRRIEFFLKYILVLILIFTNSCEKEDLISDFEGNYYKTVSIGTQIWMAENLKSTKYNDNNDIPNITDNDQWTNLSSGAYCWYQNNNIESYGALYNWYAVNTGKLCPIGWHVPSDEEWITLENYLIENGYNYDGTKTGNKIAKALASKISWANTSADGAPGSFSFWAKRNASGFSALPGGRRFNAAFISRDYEAHWWSTSEYLINQAWGRMVHYEGINSLKLNNYKYNGLSVRCIKD